MNKVARFRIPVEKVEAISEVWTSWVAGPQKGPWKALVYQDNQTFINNEQIMLIEGESTLINPIVTRIMEILKT